MSFSLSCLHTSLEDLKDTWNCEVGPRWWWSAWCGWPPPPAGGHHLGGEGSGEGWGGGAGGEDPQLRLPLGTDHINRDIRLKTLRVANVHCTIISLMVILYLDLHSVRAVRGFARKQRRHLVRGSSGYLNARESFIKENCFCLRSTCRPLSPLLLALLCLELPPSLHTWAAPSMNIYCCKLYLQMMTKYYY